MAEQSGSATRKPSDVILEHSAEYHFPRPPQDVLEYFDKTMRGYLYGRSETLNAFSWFLPGWQARTESTAPLDRNAWQDAVIDALVVNCIYTKEHDADPRKALGDLILREQKIALDPAVSAEARALQGSGSNAEPTIPIAWIARHESGDSVFHFSKAKGWNVEVVATERAATQVAAQSTVEPLSQVQHPEPAVAAPLQLKPARDKEAVRLAKEFVQEPEHFAQVKAGLVDMGLSTVADALDEAVYVSRAYLRAVGEDHE